MTSTFNTSPRVVAVPRRSFDLLAMYAFVTLGLPDGMIGTAWPSLRHGFRAPLDDLGLVLLAGTVGALASSSVAGLLLAHVGTRGTIVLGGLAGAIGGAGIVLSPAFWAFLLAAVSLGVASGLLDSAGNASVAMSGRNRLLNLIHGCYGVGSSLGPLVVTAAILLSSWRAAYGALVVVEVSLVLGWWWVGRNLSARAASSITAGQSLSAQAASPPRGQPSPPPPSGPGTQASRPSRARVLSAVGVGLVVFMVYVGLEAGAGQWEASFARGPLHLSAAATGFATFGYWGSLMIARFGLAAPRHPVPPAAIVRWGSVVGLAATGLVWWRPSDVAALVGMVILGGALAGVFPALMALTPARVGEDIAHHVIGWQIGAAGVGGSIISALFGLVFQRYGLGQFGPCLVVVAAVLIVGVLVLERVGISPPALKPAT